MPQAKKLSVLLADDNALFQEGVKRILYGLDDSVEDVEAASYSEAFKRICEEAKFDKALVDLAVPGLDGFRCLKALCDEVGDAPVVIASAMKGGNGFRRAMDCGASGYVPKALYSKDISSHSNSCSRAGSTCRPACLVVSMAKVARNGAAETKTRARREHG